MPKVTSNVESKSSTYGTSDESVLCTPRLVSLTLVLRGEALGPGYPDCLLLAVFNGQIVLDGKWQNGYTLESEALALNLHDLPSQLLVADKPLILLLRGVAGKGSKDPDPLLNADNRAGASVDLFPLVLGEEEVHITVPLVSITTGENIGYTVEVIARSNGVTPLYKAPLLMTMVSGHCLPQARDGTVYMAGVGLDGVYEPRAINFGMSLSSPTATKVVWATANSGGYAANTALNVPNEDIFVPEDLQPQTTLNCTSVYWNSMKRILVDPVLLRDRLSTPLLIEVAGVPKFGKIDVRGRYMGFIDVGVLLEPGQFGVSTSTKLLYYNEADLPENTKPLLELPPTSAKISARDTDLIKDEYGHSAYVVVRFDLVEPLVPKCKIAWLFETMHIPLPEGPTVPCNVLDVDPPPEDPVVDVRKIRKDGGALAVHRELGSMACRAAVPMGQTIKRTAANRLLMRVRTMLKQFSPGDCSYIEWQDTVTGQHAATRRAVTASFAPQSPPPRPPPLLAASRCRIAGDQRIVDHHIKTHLEANHGHPASLLSKALACLEARDDSEARIYFLEALNAQPRNRFLLWIFGAQEFDKGSDASDAADAALRIAVKGDYSAGTSNAIGWAALHAFYHFNGKLCSAFVAGKKMRKSYELPREWKKFYQLWIASSGQEETFWIPTVIATFNPLLIAAAFFLCLRCYKFAERLLKCVESGCATKGARIITKSKIGPDVHYLRVASHLLRRQYEKALEVIKEGVKRFGPSALMSQMQTSCLTCINGWDGVCEASFLESEKAGALQCPALLYQAALSSFRVHPKLALQRAARCHKLAPGPYSALLIGRIYALLGEHTWAERWAAVAVQSEPLLADGWAVLAILAMHERDVDKARTMIRTANQVGPVSPDIRQEMEKMIEAIKMNALPDALVKDLCLCNYY